MSSMHDLEEKDGHIHTPAVNAVDDGHCTISPQEDARIRRKADFNLLPLLCIVYGLQFLDKTCMSYAVVMGFRTDTHVTLDQYSWLASIYYFGYLVAEYPFTWMLQKLPIAKLTSANVIIWGTLLSLMSVGKNFTGLMILRFFLGMFESSITPAVGLFMGQYYKVGEQGSRTGVWFSFNGLSGILGGLLAYGLYTSGLKGNLPIAGWKLVYIILGSLTVAAGLLMLLFVPDTPDQARWLNTEEKLLVKERIRANQQGVIDKTFKREQVMEALTDPLTWMYCAICLLTMLPNGGLTNFFAILISGFGFDIPDTLLFGLLTTTLGIHYVVWPAIGDRLKRRALVSIFPTFLSTIGVLLVWKLPESNRVGRLVSFIISLPLLIPYAISVSFITSNVAGYTKKTTVNGLFFVTYCVGNLIGPQTFRAKYAPRYVPALITIVVCNIIVMGLMAVLHCLYVKENKRRDRLIPEAEVAQVAGHEFDDMTDRQNPAFRYVL